MSHDVGFCSKCGIVREDVDGVPVTDCVCTAKLRHKEGCTYVKAVSMWFSVGGCEVHGRDACEDCDCDCKMVESAGIEPAASTLRT